MKWSDDFATGVERIDEQHRMIFRMAGDFREALDEGHGERTYGLLLEFLDRYCQSHFKFEERCMEERRCAFAQRNKDAHAHFVEVVADFQARFAKSGYRVDDARELVDTVDRWLSEHICGIDVHLKDSIER
jgi:hemerythrin